MTNETLGPDTSDNFGDTSLDGAADALLKRMSQDSEGQSDDNQDDEYPGEDEEQPGENEEETDDNKDESDDLSEQSEDDADEGTDGAVDVEYEGKTYSVPAELKDALLRQSDYTRKTTELAERTRLAESNLSNAQIQLQFADAISEVKANLRNVENQIAYYEKNIDWNTLRTENPAEFSALATEYQAAQMSKRDIQAQLQGMPAQFQQQIEQNLVKHREEAQKDIKRRIPGFNQQTEAEIVKYGTDMGFTLQELRNGALDPRMIQVLNEARLYRNLKDKKPQITQKVPQGEQKVVKPGATKQGNRMDAEAESRVRLKKSGSINDAASLMEARLVKKGFK